MALYEIYMNNEINDDQFIGRLLNTVLPTGDETPTHIVSSLQHLMTCIKMYGNIHRSKVKWIIEKMDIIIDNNYGIEQLANVAIESWLKQTFEHVYVLCFCRAIWEINYESKIHYNNPIYAVKIAMGHDPWAIFMEAVKNNDYVLI